MNKEYLNNEVLILTLDDKFWNSLEHEIYNDCNDFYLEVSHETSHKINLDVNNIVEEIVEELKTQIVEK